MEILLPWRMAQRRKRNPKKLGENESNKMPKAFYEIRSGKFFQ